MHVTLLHDVTLWNGTKLWHGTNVQMHVTLWMHVTIWMRVTLWHGTNACQTVAWYQCISHYGMKPMHVTLWHDTNVYHGMDCTDACHTIWHGTNGHTIYGMVAIIVLQYQLMYIILRHETNVYQHYKIRHTYTNCNICQHYAYGMASIHVTCTICIMSLLMPWHNTTSVNTKTICIPLLTLMPWYGTTISTIWNDTYLHYNNYINAMA